MISASPITSHFCPPAAGSHHHPAALGPPSGAAPQCEVHLISGGSVPVVNIPAAIAVLAPAVPGSVCAGAAITAIGQPDRGRRAGA
jgi:hypothetical protein